MVRFINLEHYYCYIGFGKSSCTLMLHLHGDHVDVDPHINKMKWVNKYVLDHESNLEVWVIWL